MSRTQERMTSPPVAGTMSTKAGFSPGGASTGIPPGVKRTWPAGERRCIMRLPPLESGRRAQTKTRSPSVASVTTGEGS